MKKTLICFLAAIVMLSVYVSAGQTEPDANGNVVCSGTAYRTEYNPENLNAIMRAISDASFVSETTNLVECMEDGAVRMDYRPAAAEGGFIEFAKARGKITANTALNRIEIAEGNLFPLETPDDNRIVPISIIGGKQIILQFVKDARQKVKPMFKLSNDGAVMMEDERIFFACLKKDANGRALQCAISGQLYKEGDADEYLTITGSGFVSEEVEDSEGQNMLSNYLSGSNNIEELKENSGLYSPEDFVAIPLTDLKEIKVTITGQRIPKLLSLYAKAQAETSAIDSVRIKSAEEIKVYDLIENYKPKVFDDYMGKIVIAGKDDIRAIINSERQAQGTPFMISPDAENARVSVYMSGSKIVESTGSIYVFSESAEEAYNAINEDMALETDSILLKPSTNEIKIHSVFSAIDAYLLTDYNTVTIVPQISGDITGSSVKVTNMRNGAWILYENNELTWTPGKTIAGLGFNFNVNLNPAAGEDEMLRCTTDGICWLGDTMVVGLTPGGLTQEKLNEGIENARTRPRERSTEEGAKGVPGSMGSSRGWRYEVDRTSFCSSRGDCPEDAPCINNQKCAIACNSNSDCSGTCSQDRKLCILFEGSVDFNTKGIGETMHDDTLGQKCDTDEDCGATEYCNLVGRERVCVLQEQRAQGVKESTGEILGYEYDSCSSNNDCQRGLICFNRLCRATCSERNGFSADEGCFIDTFLNSACVEQSNGIRICEVECETDSNCARMPVDSACVEGECLPGIEEGARTAAQKGVFARAWDWTKSLFGAKTIQENACDAAGGICRDICYYESEEASTSRSATDACFLTPIAGQPIETRKCCIPKEQESLNDCTILSGTCKSPENCDTSRGADWPWQDDYQGSESIVMGRDANEACGSVYHRARPGPVGIYRRSRGDICCVPLDICPDIEGIGGCSTA